jgi:hypothetical protein
MPKRNLSFRVNQQERTVSFLSPGAETVLMIVFQFQHEKTRDQLLDLFADLKQLEYTGYWGAVRDKAGRWLRKN